jgi:hypothetical protein
MLQKESNLQQEQPRKRRKKLVDKKDWNNGGNDEADLSEDNYRMGKRGYLGC